jgi:diadenosine tetraphosphate (Ap4A) HIT family hydrolase
MKPCFDDYSCPVCLFSLWHPICRLSVSVLGLYNDARFPGRCLLVLDKHVEDFTELDKDLLLAFSLDSQIASRAIRKVTKAIRINYAVLGNREPHLHFHLIPRGQSNDPIPHRAPWEHPKEKHDLSTEVANQLKKQIREEVEILSRRKPASARR